MNYRHAFHAGNHADVLKHVVLLAMIDALLRKDSPFFVLDTHAGRGRYLLQGGEAGRTAEAAGGILALPGADGAQSKPEARPQREQELRQQQERQKREAEAQRLAERQRQQAAERERQKQQGRDRDDDIDYTP